MRARGPTARIVLNALQIAAWGGVCGGADAFRWALRDTADFIAACVIGSVAGGVVAALTLPLTAYMSPRLLAGVSLAFASASALMSWWTGAPFAVALSAVPLYGLLVAFVAGIGGVRDTERPGCCHACGYDLAGLPDGVCPECGTERAA